MTIAVCRHGILVVDSLVSADARVVGETLKWSAVPPEFGGGFIAASGNLALTLAAVRRFVATGEIKAPDESGYLHLRADGTVWELDSGGEWYHYEAPWYAIGSGQAVAAGALAAGATAREAVEICCKLLPAMCGGTIHALHLHPTN